MLVVGAFTRSVATMPPIALNRRRFLGCSAAASLALSQGTLAEADLTAAEATPVRLGLIGIGNRGTALLRALLDLPAARRLLERPDVDAVIAAVPCDLHESIGCETLRAGKHLYAEKPLALTLAGCDRLCIEASRRPALVVHVGFQRRSNPRFREGVERIQGRELGPLIEARATWTSSNGPLSGHGGWPGRRDRSGDFMVEQAVHIWDILHWLHGDLPVKAAGWGRRGLFAQQDPGRDVTDHYAVELEWADGFRASLLQSWVAPAADGFTGSTLRVLGEAGGLDFGAGSLTFRDRQKPRQAIHPGPQNDTRLALLDFLTSVRAEKPLPPPITLAEARSATLTGLLVRKAVDERRTVTMDEIRSESSNA